MVKKVEKANFLAVGSIILWCFSGVCFRKGAEGIGAMTYLAVITGIGVFTAVLIQILRKKRVGSLFRLPRKVIIAGIPGITIYTVFLAFAFAIADPRDLGLINLINYLWPMWLVLLEIFFLKRKPRKIILIAGFILGSGGLYFAGNFDFSRPVSFLPHLLALSGGLFWAAYSVLLKVWNVPEEQAGTAFHFAICSIISLFISMLSGELIDFPQWSLDSLFWVIIGGVGPVGIAYYFWELAMKNGTVSIIAPLSNFIPIGSSVIIGLLFREALHGGLLPGALMIALGAYAVRVALSND